MTKDMEEITMQTSTFIDLVHTQAKMQIERNEELSLNDVLEILLDLMEKGTKKTMEDNK